MALGSFSYMFDANRPNQPRALTYQITIPNGAQYILRLKRVTDFMATLTYIQANGTDIPPPVPTTVFCPTNGQIVPLMGISWPVIWQEPYMVRIDGRDVLRLYTQRQQYVMKMGDVDVVVHGQRTDPNPLPLPPQALPAGAVNLMNGIPAVNPQPQIPFAAPLPQPIPNVAPPAQHPAPVVAQAPGENPALQVPGAIPEPQVAQIPGMIPAPVAAQAPDDPVILDEDEEIAPI